MDKKIIELLNRSFDSILTKVQQNELDEALQKSHELREEKESLIRLRKRISGNAGQTFSAFFADKVMAKITSNRTESNEERFFESLISVFRPVAIAAAMLLVILVSYNILNNQEYSLVSSFTHSQVTLEDAFDPILDLTLELIL